MIDRTGPLDAFVGTQAIDLSEWYEAIIRVLAKGWNRAAAYPDRHAQADEVSMTQCLRKGMREELKAGASDWSRRMSILPGTESQSRFSPLKPDGLTDISVFLQDIRERYDEHDPHAIIECKRVTEHDATLCRLYVAEGIDRFSAGQYAIKHREGFMVGYVISGGIAGATAKINRRLSRKNRPKEYLQQSNVVRAPWTWVSRHPRQKPYVAIELHHAFFRFYP